MESTNYAAKELTMATYKTRVKPGGKGTSIAVTIEAKTATDAKRLLEGQYGKGNVIGSISRVRP